MTAEQTSPIGGWAILELMGHRRLAGFITETNVGGSVLLRIDIPAASGDGPIATQFYSPSAVYCLTPTSEETARAVARNSQPAPVQRWELGPAIDYRETERDRDEL